ncbi:MAG TPA: hypothetical protein VHZ74_06485, partial [Bryobacteraceae bacterium]|nr:hypothetical protein [Bryobacteraceae bacterium]
MPIDLVTQLAGAAIRACGLCLIAFVGLFLFRVRSSAARHAIWTVALAGMLLQIPLGMVAPAVQWKVLPASIQQQIVERAPLSIPAVPTPRPARPTAAAPGRRSVRSSAVTLSGIFTGIYLAISMLLFVRMALGSWGLRRILRDSKPVPTLGPGIFESA